MDITKMSLKDPEYQKRVLSRITYHDIQTILGMLADIKDELLDADYLDEFLILVCHRIQTLYHPGDLTEQLIRQYSSAERLPSRMVIYQLMK